MKARYLTKSRFKLAMECPTKLFYTGKDDYIDDKLEDPFLEALAEGGFQVGELATAYYPGGENIETLDYEQSLKETNAFLEQENCVIYEAAIRYGDLFIRVDILEKKGNHIRLIEVKAKSTDDITAESFYQKRGNGFIASWKPYLYDVAFQTYVAEQAFPNYEVSPYLMLVNKNTVCPTNGLNQKFKIQTDDSGRKFVSLLEPLNEAEITNKLLVEIDMREVCDKIQNEDTYSYLNEELAFTELIHRYSHMYKENQMIDPQIGNHCKNCEFKANDLALENGLKSGYHECFTKCLNWEAADFAEDTVFDLWNSRRADQFIQEGKIKLANLTKEDVGFKDHDGPGLSTTMRQWLQIEKSKNNDPTYYIDKEGLRKEMASWTFPLHFIDFETASPAIPFNKGRRPYEGIAFQFSHHIVYEDGTVEHKNQFLNTEPGFNPNYEFLRALKQALEHDQGTIFKYSPHENTYLNMIEKQLQADESEIEDQEALSQFIHEITESKTEKRVGPRNMVDLLEVVKKYYYDPYMKGSNSIKVVLPAILNASEHLQEKYKKPLYGSEDGIQSLNFTNQIWIQFDEHGRVKDPYQLLPKLFQDISDRDYEHLHLHEDLNNGGAAMTAYERLQFEEIPEDIRAEVEKGMLKYCELDTLAMVMIYEAWVEMTR